jgi:hypothetical protein
MYQEQRRVTKKRKMIQKYLEEENGFDGTCLKKICKALGSCKIMRALREQKQAWR